MQKKNGELRLRINLTHSNKQIKRENFKLQTNSDITSSMAARSFFFQTGCILRASPNWAGWEKLRTEPFYISPLQCLHFFIGQYSNCSKVWKDLRLSDRQSMMKDRGWQKQKNLSWGWTNWSIDSGSKRLLIWVTNCLQPDLETIKTITDMTSPKEKSQIKHRVDGNLKSLMTECPNFKQRSEGHPWNADSLTHSYSNKWSQILPCGGCYCCRQKSHKLVNWRAHFVFFSLYCRWQFLYIIKTRNFIHLHQTSSF